MASFDGADLGEVMEPLQTCLLRCNLEADIIRDHGSVSEGAELRENVAGTALRSEYGAWAHVDFHDEQKILRASIAGYIAIRSATGFENPNSSFGAPHTLCPQNPIPCQPNKIDATIVQSLLNWFQCISSANFFELCQDIL